MASSLDSNKIEDQHRHTGSNSVPYEGLRAAAGAAGDDDGSELGVVKGERSGSSGSPMQLPVQHRDSYRGPGGTPHTGGEDVHQTYYDVQAEDDDNTFVDHGSTSLSVLPSTSAAAARMMGGSPSGIDGMAGTNVIESGAAAGGSGISRVATQVPSYSDQGFVAFSSPSTAAKPPIPNRDFLASKAYPIPPPPMPLPQQQQQQQQQFRTGTFGFNPSMNSGGSISDPFALRHASQSGFAVTSSATIWNPPRVVSQMSMEQSVRTMTVAPDGKSLWLAIGDDPLTVLDVEGTDLVVSKSIDSVTKVYCIAVVTLPGMQHTRFKSMTATDDTNPNTEGKEDSYFLWCGLNKGHICIVDLQQTSDAGYIRNAHATTLHRIWFLPNGKVWTSGLDKAVKVWDPQTRRKLKNRNIAAILMDLCYVSVTKEVWGIAEDNVIRVYEGGGDNARINKQTGENTLKMKSELVLVKYCEDANLVWAGYTKGTALIDPVTYEIACHVNVTLSSLAFNEKTAIVTGHGSLLECDIDCVAVLDITNPQEPTPLFIGSQMEGVSPIGMHLFTATPLAIVAQDVGRYQKKSLTVFTYEETAPIGRYNPVQSDLPQRRISGNFRGVPPLLNSMRQNMSYSSETATGGGTTAPGAALPGSGRDDVPNRGPLLTTDFHGVPLTRSQAALATSPAMLGLLEDIAVNTKETRNMLAMLHHGQAPVLDFARLQSSAAQWALNQEAGALPPLDAEESETINREYSTSEGKALATLFAQLQKAASRKVGQPSFKGTRGAGVGQPTGLTALDANRDGVGSNLELGEQTLRSPYQFNSTTRFQSSLAAGGGGADVRHGTAPHTGGDAENENGLLQQLASHLSRTGTTERASYQHQIQLFQRYNKRLVERQNALLLGLSRIDQVTRTVALQLVEDLSEAAAETKDTNPAVHQKLVQQSAFITDALQSLRPVSSGSTPREINETVASLTGLLPKLWSGRPACTTNLMSGVFGDSTAAMKLTPEETTLSGGGGTAAVGGGEVTHNKSSTAGTASGAAPLATKNHSIEVHNALTAQYDFLPGEVSRITIDSLLLSPKRLLSRIGEEIGRMKSFVERATEIRSRTENLRHVAYTPYEGHKVPDLAEDFMQFAPLLDLQEAKLMMDVCRMEGFLYVTEGLLDRQEDAVFLALSGSSGLQERKRRTEAEMEEFSRRVSAELRNLVVVTLLVEGFASQVRSSIGKLRDGIPPALAEHVARTSGGFLSLDAPLEIDKNRYNGSTYWVHVSFFLLTQCLEAMETLLLPSPSTEKVVYLNRENFEVMTQQLLEWKDFVQDVRSATKYFQVITTVWSLEREALRKHGSVPTERVNATNTTSSRTQARESKSKEASKRSDVQAILLGKRPASSSSHSSTGPSLHVDPMLDGDVEPSLRYILVLLYVRDLLGIEARDGKGAVERTVKARYSLDIDTHLVSAVLQKCDYLFQFINFLEQRVVQLAEDGSVLSDDGKTLIISPVSLDNKMANEGLSNAQKMFCKQLTHTT